MDLKNKLLYTGAVVAYGVSVGLFVSPWTGMALASFFFLFHLVSVGLAFLATFPAGKSNDRLWGGKAALLAVCMPLAGIPFFITIAFTSHGKHQDSLLEYEEHVQYTLKPEELLPDEMQQRAFLKEKMNLQSFIDVIHSRGQVEEKIQALNTLPTVASPNIINMVKIASRDTSPEVKFIAASVIKKIEKPMMEEMKFWSEETKKDAANTDGWVNLGNLYFNYCYLGIPDDVNMSHYIELAVQAYKRALKLAPGRPDLLLAVGKALVRQKQYDEALTLLERYIAGRPGDSNGYVWKAEALFQKKEYRQLKAFFKTVKSGEAGGWDTFDSIKAVWT